MKEKRNQADRGRKNSASSGHPATWLCLVLILGVTFAAFQPVLHHEFVDWDDFQVLRDNHHLHSLNQDNLRWMATTGHMAQWQPLAWFVFGLQYQFSDAEDHLASSHRIHLVSLMLHGLAAVLCFFLIRKLLAIGYGTDGSGALNLAAVTGAVFFAVHPLRVELVGWATAQPYILALVLCLASVLCYLQACEGNGKHRTRWLVLSWSSFTLSLLCKPIAVPLVVVLLLLDWYPLQRLGKPHGWFRAAVRNVWLEKIPYLVVAVVTVLLATWAKGGGGSAMTWEAHGLLPRIAQASYGLVFYPFKTLIPLHLSPLYELQLPLTMTQPRYLITMAIVLLTLVWLVMKGHHHRAVSVALLAYAALIFPVLGFLQSGNQEVADRYGYLPGVAWAVLLGAGWLQLWFWIQQRERSPRWLQPVVIGLMVILVGLSLHASRLQDRIWHNTTTLWTHAAALQKDSSLAQNSYGFVLLQQGQVDAAIAHFQRAIELKADNEMAHRNLWTALQQKNDQEALIKALHNAIRIFPDQAEFHRFLGNAHYRQRQYAKAVAAYQQGLARQPDDGATHAALAGAHLARRETELARQHAQRALTLDPGNSTARQVMERIQGN